MEVQVLVENVVFNRNFVAEHGLSLLIKKDDKKVLIDTGQSDNFIKNSGLLGIDLKKIDKVVLTHGHYDHVGGLEKLIEENKDVRIYANKMILRRKYALRKNGHIDEIGFDPTIYEMHKDNFALIDKDTEIENDIFIVTNSYIEYDNDFTTKNFLVEKDDIKVDDGFLDEIFVAIKEGNSMHIITGCSHVGILNILYTAKMRFKEYKIKSLIGGFHLKGMPSDEVLKIANAMKEYDIDNIYAGHCIGIDEYAILKQVLGENIEYLTTSSSIIV